MRLSVQQEDDLCVSLHNLLDCDWEEEDSGDESEDDF